MQILFSGSLTNCVIGALLIKSTQNVTVALIMVAMLGFSRLFWIWSITGKMFIKFFYLYKIFPCVCLVRYKIYLCVCLVLYKIFPCVYVYRYKIFPCV